MRTEALMALGIVGLICPMYVRDQTSYGQESSGAHPGIAFVTDDLARRSSGCDSISVIDPMREDLVFRGTTEISPGKIAVPTDLRYAISNHANGNHVGDEEPPLAGRYFPFLYLIKLEESTGKWLDYPFITGLEFSAAGGIGVSPDGSMVYVGLGSTVRYAPGGIGTEFSVAAISFAGISLSTDGSGKVRSPSMVMELPAPAAEILVVSDRRAYILTTDLHLHVVDLESFTPTEAAIPLPALSDAIKWLDPSELMRALDAAATIDGSYVVTNRWYDESGMSLTIVDTELGTSTIARPDTSLRFSGGVALHRDPTGRDLLAVHGKDRIGVFEMTDGELLELANVEVEAPPPSSDDALLYAYGGSRMPIEWSADGRSIFFGEAAGGAFRSIEFDDGTSSLSLGTRWTACSESGIPLDVVTANSAARSGAEEYQVSIVLPSLFR